jgi:hypothetical protein
MIHDSLRRHRTAALGAGRRPPFAAGRRARARSLVLGALAALWLSPAAEAGEPAWRFEVEQGASRTSTLTVQNRCAAPHSFRVEAKNMPFFTLETDRPVLVEPAGSIEIGVTFDARDLKPRTYERTLVIRCVDCKAEPGCRQDKDELGVAMTVVAPRLQEMAEPMVELASPTGDPTAGSADPALGRDTPWPSTQCPEGTRLVTRHLTVHGHTIAYLCCFSAAKVQLAAYSCPPGRQPQDLNGKACCLLPPSPAGGTCFDCGSITCPQGFKLAGTVCARSLPASCEIWPFIGGPEPAQPF